MHEARETPDSIRENAHELEAERDVLPETRPLESVRGVLGGKPVFPGTRTPARIMLDYLADGEPLETFLDDFPGVRREDAEATLELLREQLPALARRVSPED